MNDNEYLRWSAERADAEAQLLDAEAELLEAQAKGLRFEARAVRSHAARVRADTAWLWLVDDMPIGVRVLAADAVAQWRD